MTQTPDTLPEPLEISCRSCGSKLTLESHMRTARCPWCGSTSIVERPPTPDRPLPDFVVGFVITQHVAVQRVRRWIRRSSLFARSDFRRAAADLTRGVYLPACLYSSVADSQYSAEIGENYTETETYTTTDANGNTKTETRTVTRTEWRSLTGRHASYILDIIVSASRGVANQALEAIEPFDLRAVRRYSPWFLSGWLAEEPSMTQDQCKDLARSEASRQLQQTLKEFMPGDSHTDLRCETEFSDESVALILLPVWSFAIRYAPNKPPVQVLVNGQTGRVGGRVPLSVVKISAAIGLVVGVAILLLLLFNLKQGSL